MEAAADQIAAKAEALARELVVANAGLQAAQTRQENAAREADDAKKAAAYVQAAAKKSGEDAAELRGQVEFFKKQNEAEKMASAANNPKSA